MAEEMMRRERRLPRHTESLEKTPCDILKEGSGKQRDEGE
jgi:hypothetical protein